MTCPIPTIDLARMSAAEAAAAVDAACRDAGFFYVAGHGVDPALEDGMFEAMRAFFGAAKDFKERYHIRHSHPHQRGYVPLYEEHLGDDASPDFKESFDLGVDRAPDHPDVQAGKPFAAPNVWPDMPGFRDTVEAYHAEMIRLGDDLVRLTAIGLGLDPGYFDYAMRDPVANLRLLHYPPRARPADLVGCGSHTDYGFLTILAQDHVGGLEIEGDGGGWIYVPPVEGAFVVNLGDLLTRWTAGAYRARRHRVAGTQDRDRYSIPFFLDPNVDAMVETVPTCRHLAGADAPPVSAGVFLQSRFDDTFSYRDKAGEALASQGPGPYVAPQ
ncbi:MAG: isopenicillin N synthase family dioxygenase [Rhodospirillales bacterium]